MFYEVKHLHQSQSKSHVVCFYCLSFNILFKIIRKADTSGAEWLISFVKQFPVVTKNILSNLNLLKDK